MKKLDAKRFLRAAQRRIGTGRAALCLVLALALVAPAGTLGQSAGPKIPALLLGASWYPEQWPESRWNKDLQLMEDAHLDVVRVGEFAWSTEEPAEGVYKLGWLARAIHLAQEHHIFVVLGTPTDAPPVWLTDKYPETLRVKRDGRRAQHGARRQFNYADPLYRTFCAQIVTQLAQRFGHNPDVIGWQIDNEYTDESFDAGTRRQFDNWLKAHFGTIAALNRDWTTAYWSETYDHWSEIPLPMSADENPGLLLAYKQFVTDTWRSYQGVQTDIIRKYADPRQFITTNFGGLGWSDHFDHYVIARDLSLASWDDYVGEGQLHVARNGAMNDLVRGFKRANFWVMETQPGAVDWAPVNTTLDRGETRAIAWQDVGHGADAVLYWQWRSALNGQEQYHGSLVGPDGEPLPIYKEISGTGRQFQRAAAAVAGTTPVAQVAILDSYDSRWAIDFQRFNRNYHQLSVLLDYYRPLRHERLTVDIVNASAPLDKYKLVLAPDLNVISPHLAAHLLAYVEQGGDLLLGPRSGMKNQYDGLNVQRQPGPLAGPLGGRVVEYYALDTTVPVSGELGAGTATLWAERLSVRAKNDKVLLRYGKANGWLDGHPAMITRSVGKGRISYLGAVLDPALMTRVMAWAASDAHVRPEFPPVPKGVEVCRRVGADHTIFILINHGVEPANVTLPEPMKNVLKGDARVAQVRLPSQGVAVLETPAH
jgi:beta-galactosidase